MSNYDFHQALEPGEFEKFACAMMSVREHVTLKRFGEGQDGGVDGCYRDDSGQLVLQAKRLSLTGKTLLAALRPEVEKAKRLDGKRYILVLSCSLSPELEVRILEMFDGCIVSEQDIVTKDDLNGYLESPQYHSVELAFPKLWLAGSAVLEELLRKNSNHGSYQRMKTHMMRIQRASEVFVETGCFKKAVDILEERRRIILSGEPGVGKTVHAYCLAKYFATWRGYDQIWVVDSISNIYDLIDEEKKQIFIVDDFWGKIRFSEKNLGINPEKSLVELLEDVEWRKNLMVIITTREFVLQQGLRVFSEIDDVCVREKLVVNVEEYTMTQKAKILFRHLHASNLEWPYVKAIYEMRDSFIRYAHYTPRAVEYYLNHVPYKEKTPVDYAKGLLHYMVRPCDFWNNIYRCLTPGARLVCLILFLSEEEMLLAELNETFIRCAKADDRNELEIEEFDSYVKEVEGTFTLISIQDEGVVIDLINHSMRDFFKEYLEKHIAAYEEVLCQGLMYFNQLYVLVDGTITTLSQSCKNEVLKRLTTEIDQLKFTFLWNADIDFFGYEVHAPADAYQLHKVWWLMLLYREDKHEILTVFLSHYSDHICRELAQGNRPYEYHEMVDLPDLLVNLSKEGVPVAADIVIPGYFSVARWVEEYYYMDKSFQSGFEAEYGPFRKAHLKEIQKTIEFLVLEDIDYLLDEDEFELEMYVDQLPEIFENFGMEYTQEWEQQVLEWAEMEDKQQAQQADKETAAAGKTGKDRPISKYKIEEEEYETMAEQAEEWLLGTPEYLEYEELEKALLERIHCPKELEERGDGYFLLGESFCMEDLDLVLDYLAGLSSLPASIVEFYRGFSGFLESRCSVEQEILIRLANVMYENDITTVAKNGDIIRGIIPEDDYRERVLEELLSAHILRKSEKWISFLNDNLYYFYLMAGFLEKPEEERAVFYRKDLLEFLYRAVTVELVLTMLKTMDNACYEKYFLEPYRVEFLEHVDGGTEEEIVKRFLEEYDMTIDLNEDEWNGNSCSVIPILNILDMQEETFYIMEEIQGALETIGLDLAETVYQCCPAVEKDWHVRLIDAMNHRDWQRLLKESGSENLIINLIEKLRDRAIP